MSFFTLFPFPFTPTFARSLLSIAKLDELQIWATLLFYAVLIDVADTVANEFEIEAEKISIEMLFCSFSYFNHAYNQDL
ncbi:hypothetical protein [Nostoc sp. DedQUE09]|uniref:hypothetical protein n=1 Tax=Nostoc sp. DedQUE09 TaxID=3075394 RepID=UPI002AD3341D|nr:hypothetical protein [Nostoc sp. DedQUE09]MDZ7951711.1 hypothetical protein [Nostoc sp. DedQUE09]